MTQRFVAPPGWPQPEAGWAPPPGWEPDPSWPPAPAGWNFWVEEAGTSPAGYASGAPTPPPAAAGSPFTGGAAQFGSPQFNASTGGSAQAALTQNALKGAKKGILISLAILAVGVIINVISMMDHDHNGRGTVWYGIILVGLVYLVRSIIAYFSAKKNVANLPGGNFDASAYAPSSPTMPNGSGPITSPGATYTGQPGEVKPGEYRP